MYATNLHDQLINAALPLKPLTAWPGGACTVTVAVPPAQSTVGVTIDSVRVELELPSGQTASADAVNVSGSPNWAATFAAELFATSGFVENGLTVYLGGKDERSASRVWIVSKGDLEVKSGDAAPSPSGSYVVVKLRDSAPTTPTKGDAYISGVALYIYDGTAWQAIGGGGEPDASKLDGAAAYPAWEDEHLYSPGDIITYKGRIFQAISETMGEPPEGAYLSLWNEVLLRDLKQDALMSAQIGYINAVPSKADKAVPSAAGNLASLTAQGNLADSGVKPSDFATPSDLPYRLVEPGEWEFSGDLTGFTSLFVDYNSDEGQWFLDYEQDGYPGQSDGVPGNGNELSVTFSHSGEYWHITATRASLPGHLLDRAGNRVVVSGDTTLTLPDANPGYLRDFLVRLEISGSTVPTITFAAPTGETLTYETDGDEFPVPDEAGSWSYSFTENCVAHKFAVSLKKVNEVAAPQAQGGV